MVLDALSTYREGLKYFPVSVVLHRAAGRLEVALKQYPEATELLSPVLTRISNDKEASYYLGIAYAAMGELEKARRAFEVSVQFGTFRAPSLFELAALDARRGELKKAHEKLAIAYTEFPDAAQVSDMDVAVLRLLGETKAANDHLAKRQVADPANSFLAIRSDTIRPCGSQPLGASCRGSGANPQRSRSSTCISAFTPTPSKFCRGNIPPERVLSANPVCRDRKSTGLLLTTAATAARCCTRTTAPTSMLASQMPTTYVFPNRPESLDVLKRAISVNPKRRQCSCAARLALHVDGMQDAAMAEWNAARELNRAIPALLRNMGYTVLYSRQSPERAIDLFTEGISSDPQNPENYLGLGAGSSRGGALTGRTCRRAPEISRVEPAGER